MYIFSEWMEMWRNLYFSFTNALLLWYWVRNIDTMTQCQLYRHTGTVSAIQTQWHSVSCTDTLAQCQPYRHNDIVSAIQTHWHSVSHTDTLTQCQLYRKTDTVSAIQTHWHSVNYTDTQMLLKPQQTSIVALHAFNVPLLSHLGLVPRLIIFTIFHPGCYQICQSGLPIDFIIPISLNMNCGKVINNYCNRLCSIITKIIIFVMIIIYYICVTNDAVMPIQGCSKFNVKMWTIIWKF